MIKIKKEIEERQTVKTRKTKTIKLKKEERARGENTD